MAETKLITPLIASPKNWDEVEQSFGGLQQYLNQLNQQQQDILAKLRLAQTQRQGLLDRPRCFVTLDSAQTLTSGAGASISWSAPRSLDGFKDSIPEYGWNVGGMWRSNEPQIFQVKVDGLYLVSWQVYFVSNGLNAGNRLAQLSLTSTQTDLAVVYGEPNATYPTVINSTCVLPMRVGWRLTLAASQNSGASVDLGTTVQRTWFQLTKIDDD